MSETAFSFGRELRRHRLEKGISLSQLAGVVHYSKSHLSKVETGAKIPSSDLARLCDAALAADGRLVALVSTASAPPTEPDSGVTSEELYMKLGHSGTTQIGIVRRDVLAAGTSIAALWVLPEPASSAPINEETLAGLRAMFRQLRQLGQVVSPARIAPMAIAHGHALTSMAERADRATRKQLLVLAAHVATYAGWMAQETGDDRAALDWTAKAATYADAAGERDLVAYTLVRRALVELNRHDPLTAIALAEKAEVDATSPRVRALAARRAAQAHAVAGNSRECWLALDRAAVLLATDDGDRADPVIGTSHIDDPAEMVRGWCLFDLGRPREAAEVLERGLLRIPLAADRARARVGARLGLALASQRRIEEASTVLELVLRAVANTDSATIRLDLSRILATLNRWHNEPVVRELHPRLIAALHTRRA